MNYSGQNYNKTNEKKEEQVCNINSQYVAL